MPWVPAFMLAQGWDEKSWIFSGLGVIFQDLCTDKKSRHQVRH